MKTYTYIIEAKAIDEQAPEFGKGWYEIDRVTEDTESYPEDAERDALESMAEYLTDDYVRGANGWYAYRLVKQVDLIED